MGKCKTWLLLPCGVAALVVSGAGRASETVVYSYDPLGRLKTSNVTGGPNNNIGTATCFDPAGNRTRYTVGTGPAACGTGTGSTPTPPPPPPPPSGSPPVANPNSVSGPCNSTVNYNVVANDTDPNGNTPLTLVTVTGSATVDATIISSTTIQFIGSAPGSSTLYYVIQNSVGATATGTITYQTTGTQSTCFQ